jgi:hypothetical protein
MRDHTEIEALLALESLGGIEPSDRTRLATLLTEHGPDCSECAELETGVRDVAAALGEGLARTTYPAELEDRTVAAALAEPRAEWHAGSATAAPAATTHRWRTTLIAVAAAIMLVAVGSIGGFLSAPRGSDVALDEFLSRPGVALVTFQPIEGQQGRVTLAINEDGSEAFLLGSDLPALPEGQVYEFWTIAGETPASLGCAIPQDGRVREHVEGDFASADVAAVTVESDICPSTPTTEPILVATLA